MPLGVDMKAGVGFSDNPETAAAGLEAAGEAMRQAGRDDPCDLALLFMTTKHEAKVLTCAVRAVIGEQARIVGGGAVGTITNDRFGYAGDQVGIACFWLGGAEVGIFSEGGLHEGEFENGRRLGKQLASAGVTESTQMMLFYDAIYRTPGEMRLLMATGLLAGLEDELGFLPDLNGVGMMGDFSCNASKQWIGSEITDHHSLALTFSGDARIDSVIMHGCRPATRYYTVTKAMGQAILEINGQPALDFVYELLGRAIPPEAFPFFLLFGVNRGMKWSEFNEGNCASRLCLAIDPEHRGIVMFEPDMIAGTEFQIMYRSLDPDYMKPKIEGLFERVSDRKPVFAFYINCAGRAAGYGGMDMEDAVMMQKTVAGRVPVLGVYSGVEIARIMGRPRGLDWTGVFCLFSVPK
ncbi:MAG: FIST C-terminal domain-containing protein [Synergistaceae bacterium]|jgi:small ligand-binding sensory domain FIST|nr:FIST C-terminal domain-containing protein [Synergistaceae bacterium]